MIALGIVIGVDFLLPDESETSIHAKKLGLKGNRAARNPPEGKKKGLIQQLKGRVRETRTIGFRIAHSLEK